jgi:hypothetical protein
VANGAGNVDVLAPSGHDPRIDTEGKARWSAKATIIGALPSPFVRKLLTMCELQGVPYEIDPVIPFYANEQFLKISPLRCIPVFCDDEVTLADSSAVPKLIRS